MSISLTCACGKKVKAPDDAAGKRGRCPSCGRTLTIPVSEDVAANDLLAKADEPASQAPAESADGLYQMAGFPASTSDEAKPEPEPRTTKRPARRRVAAKPHPVPAPNPSLRQHFH